MAVAYIQEFPIQNRSTENYDYVKQQLGDGPFDGSSCTARGSTTRAESSASSTSGRPESRASGSRRSTSTR